jgi:hypothetical protein
VITFGDGLRLEEQAFVGKLWGLFFEVKLDSRLGIQKRAGERTDD